VINMDSARLQKRSKRGKAALVIGIAAAAAVVLALVFAVVSITPDRAAIMGILGPLVIAVFAAGAFLALRLVTKMEYDSFDAGMYLVMESVPMVCSLYDMENNLIYCNDKAHKLFGFKDREEYAGNYPSSFPEFQPGGSSSDDMAIAFISNAIKDGSATLLWYQKASNGELIPLL